MTIIKTGLKSPHNLEVILIANTVFAEQTSTQGYPADNVIQKSHYTRSYLKTS